MLEAMASLLIIAVGVLAIGSILAKLAIAWHVSRSGQNVQDDYSTEKDIERQLKHELDEAIEASSKASSTLADDSDETQPLLSQPPNGTMHVRYHDTRPPPGSDAEYRALYKSHHDRILGAIVGEGTELSLNYYDQLRTHRDAQKAPPYRILSLKSKPWSNGIQTNGTEADHDTHFGVNPKQADRILKRRMARDWIQQYFEAQKTPTRGRTKIMNGHATRMERGAMVAA